MESEKTIETIDQFFIDNLDWKKPGQMTGEKDANYDVRLHCADTAKGNGKARLTISFGKNVMDEIASYTKIQVTKMSEGNTLMFMLFTKDAHDPNGYLISRSNGSVKIAVTLSAEEKKAFNTVWKEGGRYKLEHPSGDLYYIRADRKEV